MFQVGQKVKVLDDKQEGKITSISQNMITILTPDGFEETYNQSELIPDENLTIETFQIPKSTIKPIEKNAPLDFVKEIDLHIGQLLDNFNGLTHFEMLQVQLEKVKSEIELARMQKRKKLIFIHGHGSGKLKSELHKLLSNYPKLEFYDASFRKYKLGATEVELY